MVSKRDSGYALLANDRAGNAIQPPHRVTKGVPAHLGMNVPCLKKTPLSVWYWPSYSGTRKHPTPLGPP